MEKQNLKLFFNFLIKMEDCKLIFNDSDDDIELIFEKPKKKN